MRPPRVIIAGAFILTSVFLTFLSLRSSHATHTYEVVSSPKSGVLSFFSLRGPFSIFPPNALITLTHDNITAFQARPAFFGPALPYDGLKGQLWIGSGFGDDSSRQGVSEAGLEGEEGCSDVPGYESYTKSSSATPKEDVKTVEGESAKTNTRSKSKKRTGDEDASFEGHATALEGDKAKTTDDGTDDYLHHPLPESAGLTSEEKHRTEPNSDHADIQSIQEGAEITGKVVLLSRGGCGFLEKVKWAQRRGAIALIVGDNQQGALVQMYARGDTSNVTIPSVFTSRTTAHFLATLMGPGSFIEDTIDENGKPLLKVKKGRKKVHDGPTFTTTTAIVKPTTVPRRPSKATNKKSATRTEDKPAAMTTKRPGWFKALFFGVGKGKSKSGSSRPPSSGELDWVLVEDWKDGEVVNKKTAVKPKVDPKKSTKGKSGSGDDFVIGVQDWRDPDLVPSKGEAVAKEDVKDKGQVTSKAKPTPVPVKGSGKKPEKPANDSPLQGGSTTPGSGEYTTKDNTDKTKEKVDTSDSKSKGLLTTIFGDDEEGVEYPVTKSSKSSKQEIKEAKIEGDDESEGVWVTLTPTSGASPFLDTLLVLVVSPLVTLTIVYALLLIRSRIRRRRWRAPKSVVERLPVRTYQTIVATSSGSQTPRQPSPTSSSVTTPLLQHSTSPPRPRPRSRTTTGIPEPGDLIRVNSSPLQVPIIPPRLPEAEKNASTPTSEWRKYMGKQVECVVCLEEYVDGVSRVMSLPCGHEFHAECMFVTLILYFEVKTNNK